MPTLHLLGTGAAISDPHRTTTMLAVSDDDRTRGTIVVDCGGDVLQRLLACNESIDSVDGLIVTHAHMDHTSGFPLLMEKVWLDGRERPLPVVGIAPALAQAERLWEAYEPVHTDWEGIPPIDWREISHEPGVRVWTRGPWTITGTPVDHGDTANIGLRFEHTESENAVAYSCDTAPTEHMVELADGADILVHEANGGSGDNHSTAAGAAQVARDAGVRHLVLVHLPPGDKRDDLAKARSIFANTDVGDELGSYSF